MMYVSINGRLGADAEIKTSQKGNQFLSMRVASNDFVGGEKITTWVNVLWSGERALKMAEYMKKGSSIIVHGVPKFSTYNTKNGETAVSVDVFADRVDFDSNASSSGNTQSNEASTDTGTFAPKAKAAAEEPLVEVAASKEEDDLPF